MSKEKPKEKRVLISEKGQTFILIPASGRKLPPSDEDEAIAGLLKQCWRSEWMGLSQSFDVSAFAKLMKHRNLIGEYISDEAFDLILKTYRAHASRNQLDGETIDKDFQLLAQELEIPLHMLRRCYYFGGEEPLEEPEKAEVPPDLAGDLADIEETGEEK